MSTNASLLCNVLLIQKCTEQKEGRGSTLYASLKTGQQFLREFLANNLLTKQFFKDLNLSKFIITFPKLNRKVMMSYISHLFPKLGKGKDQKSVRHNNSREKGETFLKLNPVF